MSDETRREPPVDVVRRKLLKAAAVAAGALAAGLLPYEKPAVKSFFGTRSAWAQLTGPVTINFAGQLGILAPATPEDTGQDRWQFDVMVGGTNLTINATSDPNLDIEIFLFAPGGGGVGDTNLLTGTPFGFDNSGVGASEMASVGPLAAGTYIFGIEEERGAGAQVAGAYSVAIGGDNPLGPPSQIGNELPESDLKGRG